MKSKQQNNYKTLDALISSKINFAMYRLPGADQVCLMLQTSPELSVFDDLPSVNSVQGFVVAPFKAKKSSKVIIIKPDVFLSGENNIFDYLNKISPIQNNWRSEQTEYTLCAIDTFEHYQNAYNKFHSSVSDSTFQKLVLSRSMDVKRQADFSVGEVFKKACAKYPDNFIYLLYHQACGSWLGCSPEIIVSGEKGQWKTDALAGTQVIPQTQQQITWDEKNKQEQKIVVDYIQQQLADLNIQSSVQSPRTIRSGSLVHLRSEIGFELIDATQIFKLLNILHPTPAVCGVPKQKAFDFIIENEGYDREYYSGFVGPLDFQNKTDLFVNLRCMQIFDQYLKLYAGGGILPSSTLEAEWKETQHKLQTVLSLLE